MKPVAFDESRFRKLALVSLLFGVEGSITGRTKVQKVAYLANLCGWRAFDFKFHHYGPYSDDLFSEMENLQKVGWLKEEVTGSTRDGDPLYRYSFAPEHARRRDSIVSKFQGLSPQNAKLVDRTKDFVDSLLGKSAEELEIMATLAFLRRDNPKLTDEQLTDLAFELKPNYHRKQFKDGMIVFRMMKAHGIDTSV